MRKFSASSRPRRRDWQCGQVYHVYQRGNYKQPVFHTEEQLVLYLQRLDLLARRYDVRIHAFCLNLMSNHVHFLFEPRRKRGISHLMQHLQSHHSRAVHRSLDRDGHLWKNRFGSKRISTPSHYRTALLYIERNPVTAALATRAEHYVYSSAAAHAANSPTPTWQHGPAQATVHLYLDRWRAEFNHTTKWAQWLLDPRQAAIRSDLFELVDAILGKDRLTALNPQPLPPPRPMSRAAPASASRGTQAG